MNNIIKNINDDVVIKQIKPFLSETEAYLVGGYLRDIMLEKSSYDRDIVLINTDIETIAKNIAEKLNATFIELDKDWGIYRIVLNDKKNYIDFAKAVDNSIEKDLKRRDITINSIAFNLNTNTFLDPNNGIADIKNKIINGICEKNFIEDPLRLLRVFRFQSTLGFDISEETYNIISKHTNLLENPAKERINAELIKLFEGENSTSAINCMNKNGMLELIFPFVKELRKIPPNSHHHLDLINHSIETVHQIEKLLPTMPANVLEILNQTPYGTVKKTAFLKLAAFMHDIGKPSTWTIDPNSLRHRFIYHDSKGAELAPTYLKQLKFSKKQISYIQKLIRNHIYPSNVNINNDKSIMKFLRKMGDDTIDVIILAMADRLSARGEAITEEIVSQNLNNLNILLQKYFENLEQIKPLPKLLDGNEVMELLNIPPSPTLGKILSLLHNAQEDGTVTNRIEAIEFVKAQRSKKLPV